MSGHRYDDEIDGLTYCSRCGWWIGAANPVCVARAGAQPVPSPGRLYALRNSHPEHVADSLRLTSTLWRNLAVAGALEAARINGIRFCDGDVTWRPGCGRVMPELSEWEDDEEHGGDVVGVKADRR